MASSNPRSHRLRQMVQPLRKMGAGIISVGLVLLTFVAACGDDDPGPASIPASECPAGVSFFQQAVYEPILSKQCIVCHTSEGMAKDSRLVLAPTTDPDHLIKNFDTLRQVALIDEDNKPMLLLKPSGEHKDGHTGGIVVARDSASYDSLQRFVLAVREQRECNDDVAACRGSRAGVRRLRRLTRVEYDRTVQDLIGTVSSYGANFSADAVVDGFDNNATALLVAPLLADQLREAAELLSAEAVTNLNAVTGCTPNGEDEEKACASQFITDFGGRAFRRPVSTDEQTRYEALCEVVRGTDGFSGCIELVIQAMLQSPNFLYRTELGGDGTDNTYQLSSYEVASELSYFIWGTMPDAELFAAAKSDSLRDKDTIVAQAKRMLKSPKAKPAIEHFAAQWLGVDRILNKAKDAETYPDFDDATRSAMLEETKRFVSHVLLETDGKLDELFSADYTFANDTLAAHYGLSKSGSGWEKVSLDKNRRGLLTHGSVLSTWALPGGSSPVHRGLFVRQQLLCQPLPMPPPAVNLQPPPVDPSQTTRERFTVHLTDPVCSSCHTLVDPIGFAFEHYDGIGRYRADEDGKPIDDSGEINTTSATNGPIDGVVDLADKLKTSVDIQSCFARLWFRYAYGVEESAELSCLMDDVVDKYTAGANSFEELVLSLVQSEHFLTRVDPEAPVGEGIGAVSGMAPPDYPGSGSSGSGSGSGGGSGDIEQDPPGALSVTVNEDNWGTGYCRNISVKNISSSPVTWSITMTVPGTVNNSWSIVSQTVGSKVKFSGPEWAKELAPEAEHGFGYCADL